MAAPEGNQNAVKGKRWATAIDRALAKRSKASGVEALDELAEKLLVRADEGDMSALKELGDRLEGKSAQPIVGHDGGPVIVEVVRFADTNPK